MKISKSASLALVLVVIGILFNYLSMTEASGKSALETAGSPSQQCSAAPEAADDSTPLYHYEIVNVFPHDPEAFTQGLLFADGFLYESTGLRGKSSLRKVELETGKVRKMSGLPDQYFGEGLALLDNRLFQLTWTARTGFIYDKDTFQQLGNFQFCTEGWGLTQDGELLILSDGTSYLYFLDPISFEARRRIQVTDRGSPISNLNELEYVQGEIFANVWRTDRVARISPRTGRVLGWIDLSGLRNEMSPSQPVDVLNGIAYDACENRLFVTGKLWPGLFEIRLVPSEAPAAEKNQRGGPRAAPLHNETSRN